MPSYTVTVATGSQWFAGTDDYIYLSLVGTAGCSEKHLLDKAFYNDFERGAVRAGGGTRASGAVGREGGGRAEGPRDHPSEQPAGWGAPAAPLGDLGPWKRVRVVVGTMVRVWSRVRLCSPGHGRVKVCSLFTPEAKALRGPFTGLLPGVGGKGPRESSPCCGAQSAPGAAASCEKAQVGGLGLTSSSLSPPLGLSFPKCTSRCLHN